MFNSFRITFLVYHYDDMLTNQGINTLHPAVRENDSGVGHSVLLLQILINRYKSGTS